MKSAGHLKSNVCHGRRKATCLIGLLLLAVTIAAGCNQSTERRPSVPLRGVTGCVGHLRLWPDVKHVYRDRDVANDWCERASKLGMLCAGGDYTCGRAKTDKSKTQMCEHQAMLSVEAENVGCPEPKYLCENGIEQVEDQPCINRSKASGRP